MSGPLDGYKVVELTSTVSGPLAGLMLADQGAEVIKVEPPLMGDLARFMGSSRNGVGAMFSVLNRNKIPEIEVYQNIARVPDLAWSPSPHHLLRV